MSLHNYSSHKPQDNKLLGMFPQSNKFYPQGSVDKNKEMMARNEPLSSLSTQKKHTTQISQGEKLEYDDIHLLEIVAEKGDELKFLVALKRVNWLIRQSNDYVRAIKLALRAGAYQAARRLANEGAARFSNHKELQKYMNILAPPKIVGKQNATSQGISNNNKWLALHSKEYLGTWVALQEGTLLGSSKSLNELTKSIDIKENIFFIQIT